MRVSFRVRITVSVGVKVRVRVRLRSGLNKLCPVSVKDFKIVFRIDKKS